MNAKPVIVKEICSSLSTWLDACEETVTTVYQKAASNFSAPTRVHMNIHIGPPYLASDGGGKTSDCSNSVDGHCDNEANELNNRHPPRETGPAQTVIKQEGQLLPTDRAMRRVS